MGIIYSNLTIYNITMETYQYFLNRLKKAIESPNNKRVFVINSQDKLRIEVTEGTNVIEDVEFSFDSREHDEFEIDPETLDEKFIKPFREGNLKDLYNSLKNKG